MGRRPALAADRCPGRKERQYRHEHPTHRHLRDHDRYVVRAGCVGAGLGNRAAEARATQTRAVRAKALKDNIKDFSLTLDYYGDEDKPYYRLTLLGPAQFAPVKEKLRKADPFRPVLEVQPALAGKIIDHLATEGYLDTAKQWDLRVLLRSKRVMPKGPCYRLTVGRTAKWMVFEQDLWGKELLAKLDGLRAVLAANEKAPGGMCPKCAGKKFIASVSKCTQCAAPPPAEPTSSARPAAPSWASVKPAPRP